jgi:TonB family protein
MSRVLTHVVVVAGLVAIGGRAGWPQEPGPSPDGTCHWSTAWTELHAQFPTLPKGAKLKEPKRLKGEIKRPDPTVPRHVSGTWKVELVVDHKGDVRDARIVQKAEIEPPWPEYEEALLTSVRKWKYSPLRVDGRPWPNCMTVTVQDR